MDKVTGVVEKYLLPAAEKLSTNKYLKAISKGFSIILPIIMIGAIFTLLSSLQIGPYQTFITNTGIKSFLDFAPTVTTNMLSLYTVFVIAYYYAQDNDMQSDALVVGLLALFAFVILIPQGSSVVAKNGKDIIPVLNVLEMRFLGAAGLFSAMIVGLLTPAIYKFVLNLGWVIKMPEGVPPAVSKAFNAMIPAFIVAIVFSLVRSAFAITTFKSFNLFIYTVLQAPLLKIGNSPIAFALLVFLCSLFWFFGIHGGQIIMPILSAVYMPMAMENLAALQAGQAMPNVLSNTWWFVYTSVGGGGGTLGLCLVIFFFAKSNRFKQLGRLALPASLCGINEPLIFGLPIVLNPVIIIPFIVVPLINFILAYVFTKLGILPILNGMQIAVGTPVIFSGWLAGGIKVALYQIVVVAIQMFIYYPFFKTLDQQAIDEESAIENAK